MPQTEGQVVSLFVRQTPLPSTVLDATVTIRVKSRVQTTASTFVLWEVRSGDVVPFLTTVVRTLNATLLRQALTDKLDVIITHTNWVTVVDPSGGQYQTAYVEAVQLAASA